MHKKRRAKQVDILIICGVILALIIFVSSIVYTRVSRPVRQAKAEATQIAQRAANIETVENFYWFTRDETYFSIVGLDNKEEEMIVIIPQSGNKITILQQSEGLTENEARRMVKKNHPEEAVKKANLGVVDEKIVWEVMTENDAGIMYYLIDFKEGQEIDALQII